MGERNDSFNNSGASVSVRPCTLCGRAHASGAACESPKVSSDKVPRAESSCLLCGKQHPVASSCLNGNSNRTGNGQAAGELPAQGINSAGQSGQKDSEASISGLQNLINNTNGKIAGNNQEKLREDGFACNSARKGAGAHRSSEAVDKSSSSASGANTNGSGFPQNPNLGESSRELVQSISALVGSMIGGKYQIIEYLGHGGMSTVYKARQQPIEKIVAIKLLLAHLSRDQESVQRFFREAKAAGQISHPNVVQVFDFGITADQQPYLVMDFVEGKNLEDILDERKKLSYQEAIPIFIEVCSGLAAAHERGIVHRDIKPSNIVIEHLDGGGQKVRIVDFGIAKMIDADTQHLTKTGEVFGSPLYMSPEQCEGQTLDGRSDIYGLGVVFYQTLCGKPPLVGQSALETMRKHMVELPESLQKDPDAGDIPLELENVIFKMMAKDRDKRYASTAELKHDLQRIIDGHSEVFSSNLQYMGREISRKSKIIIASSVASVLLAVGATLAYPGVCDELGKKRYSEGMAKFAQRNSQEAESMLESAVELSRRAGDIGLENKSLASLIRLYRMQGNPKIVEARRRRQELIKQELEKLEIGSLNIGEVLSNTENELRDVERSLMPHYGPGRELSVESKPSNDLNVTDKRTPIRSEETPLRDRKQETPGSEYADVLIASRQNTDQIRSFRLVPQAKLANVAKNETSDLLSDNLQEESNTVALSSTNKGADTSDASADFKPRQDAPALHGSTAPAAAAGMTRLPYAQAAPLTPHTPAATPLAAHAPEPAAPLQIKQAHITYENLDRMEVLASLCVEREQYAKAKESAAHGVAMYRELNCHESDELALLYTLQGLSAAKLHKWDELAAVLKESEGLSDLTSSRQTELLSLKALLSLHVNDKHNAKADFEKVVQASRSEPASIVTAKAMDMYKSWPNQ